MRTQFLILLFLAPFLLFSQNKIGINTTNPTNILDIRGLQISDTIGIQLAEYNQSRFIRFSLGTFFQPQPNLSWMNNDTLFLGESDLSWNFTSHFSFSDKTIGAHNTGL